ncbi:MAG: leucine-rich repeat protein [Prevotella sp.]|nr:leucine-rich repeat protein [Prevotella sp.]
MTKKIKLTLLLIATLLPATMFGDWRDFTYTANGVTWKCSVWADGDKATIKGETLGAAAFVGVLNIPSTVSDGTKTYTVDDIGGSAFENYTGATKLILPDNLKYIQQAAFRNCTGLKGELKIPDHVEHIYYGNEFENCTGIEYITWGVDFGMHYQNPVSGCTNARYIDLTKATVGVTSYYGMWNRNTIFCPYSGLMNHTLVYLQDAAEETKFNAEEDNIIYKSKCKVFKVYDAYSYRIPYAFTAETAQCDRVFSNTNGISVSTLYLPYPTDLPDGMTAYALRLKGLDADGNKAFHFDPLPAGTRLEANHPYLVQITDGQSHQLPVMHNVQVPVTPDIETSSVMATTDADWKFYGTTERIDNAQAYDKKAYYLNGNKWWAVQNGVQNDFIAPFRSFIVSPTGAVPAKSFLMVLHDGTATDINRLEKATEADIRSGRYEFYSVDGLRMGHDYNQLKSGQIYIVNGKKFYKL